MPKVNEVQDTCKGKDCIAVVNLTFTSDVAKGNDLLASGKGSTIANSIKSLFGRRNKNG